MDWIDLPPLITGADFKYRDESLTTEWNCFVHLHDVFGTGNHDADNHVRYGTGFVTQQDQFAIAHEPTELMDRITWFIAPDTTEQIARKRFKFCTTNQWSYERARRELTVTLANQHLSRCQYRPFDYRFTILERNVCTILRDRIQAQFRSPNIALLTTRRATHLPWNHVFVTDMCAEYKIVSHDRNSIVFPLRWYPPQSALLPGRDRSQRVPVTNMNCSFVARMPKMIEGQGVSVVVGDDDIFHYVYAILHSPSYRARYGEMLTRDFARIPVPTTETIFRVLSVLGTDLVALHLLRDRDGFDTEEPIRTAAESLIEPIITFTNTGGTEIGRGHPKYDARRGRVSINGQSYFEGVSEEVWNFHIGGYPVCLKWLKDRGPKKGNPGRVLTDEDIDHYQKIVVALSETIRIMAEIDEVIEAHGGWPAAFITESIDNDAKETPSPFDGSSSVSRVESPSSTDILVPRRPLAKPRTPSSGVIGVRESAGINRLGIRNERVLQRRVSQSLWPRTVRWRR